MKVLLICESFSSKASGGRVVRYLYKILSRQGHNVRVLITSEFDKGDSWMEGGDSFIDAMPGKALRFRKLYSLADPTDVPVQFRRLLDEFQPDVAHFSSFDHTKSPNLYRHCAARGIRTVMQPYTMHFYCKQGFGFLHGHHCQRCLKSGFLTAVAEGCTKLRGAVDQLERLRLRDTVLDSADLLLSSNSDLDGVLANYGIEAARIQRFPIVFDTTEVAQLTTRRGEDYVFYGQAVAHKGAEFLIDLFRRMPQRRLSIFPMAPFAPPGGLPPNVRVIPGLGWANGLADAIANARAVLLPSLWMTSTEYALCEAMTLGKPVVVFNVGVHKDILTDRVDAMVVPPGDMNAFAEALDDLDGDPALYDLLAVNGATTIAALNHPDRLHRQLMQAYAATPPSPQGAAA